MIRLTVITKVSRLILMRRDRDLLKVGRDCVTGAVVGGRLKIKIFAPPAGVSLPGSD